MIAKNPFGQKSSMFVKNSHKSSLELDFWQNGCQIQLFSLHFSSEIFHVCRAESAIISTQQVRPHSKKIWPDRHFKRLCVFGIESNKVRSLVPLIGPVEYRIYYSILSREAKCCAFWGWLRIVSILAVRIVIYNRSNILEVFCKIQQNML